MLLQAQDLEIQGIWVDTTVVELNSLFQPMPISGQEDTKEVEGAGGTQSPKAKESLHLFFFFFN